MEVQLSKRLISVNEYHVMAEAGILTSEDKVELIQGEILEMSPIGTKHAAIVDKLTNLLVKIVSNTAIIRVQNPVYINDLNEPEPDISVLKTRRDYYADIHPGGDDTLLVIEVSDTTYHYDKEVKVPLYGSAGIPEYWILKLDSKEIEVHTVPAKGGYKKIELFYPEDLVSLSFCQKEILVSDLIG
ncbi:MAG: Uma2 family endonuclease [Bacteroidota bacterium]